MGGGDEQVLFPTPLLALYHNFSDCYVPKYECSMAFLTVLQTEAIALVLGQAQELLW